ncbi:MAG: PIN domain nuclease [Chloroflexi bacterium]|nr:PIN domain nuclease [Chloroflexota bacterium]
MILVDTSVWIDFLKGENSSERQILHKLIEDEEEISITGIILAEILQGIREDKKFHITRNYLLEFPIYEPNGIVTYIDAARIYRECRKSGKTIRSTIDCIIAAICLENDLFILHKDRDYDIIQECIGLKVFKVFDKKTPQANGQAFNQSCISC